MDAVSVKKLSFEDYIRLEQETNTKYEYHNGEVFAMAGGTTDHSTISGNIFSDTDTALEKRSSSCRPFNSDTKLQFFNSDKYVYPDMMVVCDEEDIEEQSVSNPIIVVEVLSDSTAKYDRGDKFHFYRSIASLQTYILIAQDKAQVEVFERKGDFWKISRIEGLDETLRLEAIDIEIPLTRIYRNVRFESSIWHTS